MSTATNESLAGAAPGNTLVITNGVLDINPVGQLEKYKAIGTALLTAAGLSPSALFADYDDYAHSGAGLPNGWQDQVVSGTQSALFTEPGGIIQYASTAGAATGREHIAPGGVSNTKTKLFYWATRFRLTTAFDAQGRAYIGFRTADLATGSAVLGAVGAVDTANFVLQYGGNFATSKQVVAALDTNLHILEWWNGDRNAYNVRFDGGSILNVVPAAGVTGGGGVALCRGAANGTTAALRSIDIDWHVYLGERA